MIYAYGITQQGTYHIKKDLVCQDAHNIIKVGENCVIAAVADGLGSEEHSDIASDMASKISTEYCRNHLEAACDDTAILEMIHESFSIAQREIEKVAQENGHELDQYDTTLSLAILKDNMLFYGHSGDSGIIALTTDGLYIKVTEQQRDEEGRVFPLYFGDDKWVFGKYPEPLVSVFLATDGMYEILFPVYIKNEPVSIYVALAEYFMDPNALHIAEVGEEAVHDKIDKFVRNIPDAQVNDDKTVVVIMDTSLEIAYRNSEYYAEPNWKELKRKYDEAWKRAAYPQLFDADIKEDEVCEDDSSSAAEEAIEENPQTELCNENTTDEECKNKDYSGNLKRTIFSKWFSKNKKL